MRIGPPPKEIVAAFKAGWSIARIVRESGLDREIVEAVLRKYVQPGGHKSGGSGRTK